jgi:hypothetical protein
MIVYSSRFLVRGEIWYDDDESADLGAVDCLHYNLRSRPVSGAAWRHFYTYVIDLALSTERLEARLREETAYKIRRARDRDRIVCKTFEPEDSEALDRFETMHRSFAAMKGLPALNRARLNGMAAAGVLDLSGAMDPEGNALVCHANYRGVHRATQLFAPSLYPGLPDSASRNRVGRANRWLFWSNILRYKRQGLKWFDFGGWYPGTTDRARLNINEFKTGFGGDVRREFECERILTLKGRVVLNAAKLVERVNFLRARSKSQPPRAAAMQARDAATAPAA